MAVGGSLKPAGVRIVVAGEAKTGKSSLILTAATGNFPPNVPSVLPYSDLSSDCVPVTVIDTSSSSDPVNKNKLVDELKRADVILLTYACDRPQTLDRLTSFWLPELRRLEVKVPVVVVGCMVDKLGDEHRMNLKEIMSPIVRQFWEIENYIACSASNLTKIYEVFYLCLNTVLHPAAPLVDREARAIKPRCIGALRRIFNICDQDRDGFLNDEELSAFQVKCFNAPLQPSEIEGIKKVVQQNHPEGVSEDGLTLNGFLCLHAIFIENGRLETTWTVLRKFGYDDDVKLADDGRRRLLMFASVGAAVAVVGLGAYRIYAARKSSSA